MKYDADLVDKLLDEMETIVDRISVLNSNIPDEWPPVVDNGFTGG